MQADDLDAFEEFFVRYRTPIYRTAYGLTGDPQAAEEILQDTFARAYQRRHTLRTRRVAAAVAAPRRAQPVLLAAGAAPAARRARSTRPSIGAGPRRPAAVPAERAEQAELRQIVRDGRRRPAARSTAAWSSSITSTGCRSRRRPRLLDVRLGTVKSRLHYALRALRIRPRGRPPLRRRLQRGRTHRGRSGGGGHMMGRPTGCSIHRPALTAFAERSERGPGIGPAFDHLDGCRRCQADLTEILLDGPRRRADARCRRFGRAAGRRLGSAPGPGPAAGRQRLGGPDLAGRRPRRGRAGRRADRSDRHRPPGRIERA